MYIHMYIRMCLMIPVGIFKSHTHTVCDLHIYTVSVLSIPVQPDDYFVAAYMCHYCPCPLYSLIKEHVLINSEQMSNYCLLT